MKFTAKLSIIVKRPCLRKYSKNTAWLVVQNVCQKFFSLVVGVWVARYLGPKYFGILSYVVAVMLLVKPIAALGLKGILIRNMVKENEFKENMGAALALKFLGGAVGAIIITLIMYLTKDDLVYTYIGALSGCVLTLQCFEVFEFYFLAQVKTKFIAITKMIGVLSSSLVKISFVLGGFSVVWFAGANLLDFLIVYVLLFFFIIKMLSIQSLVLAKT